MNDPFAWMKGPDDGFWTGVVCVMFGFAVWDTFKTWLHGDTPRAATQPKMIGVAPKTMLRVIVRHDEWWAVWTGVADMQRPYAEWTGTYIMLHDDGMAVRVVVQPDGTEEMIRIM